MKKDELNNIAPDLETVLKRIEERRSKESQQKSIETARCGGCEKFFKYEKDINAHRAPEFCSTDCQDKQIKAESERRILERINACLPTRYHAIETERQDLLKSYMNSSLFVHGSVGTGKTVFMATLAKERIKGGGTVTWLSFPAFIMRIQNLYRNEGGESPYEYAESVAKDYNLLCIDDLGAEKLTEFVRQIMYYILNEREQYCLDTIITSNYSLAEIDEQIDSRVSSRIAGMCKVLKMDGRDRRIIKT